MRFSYRRNPSLLPEFAMVLLMVSIIVLFALAFLLPNAAQ